MKLKNPDRWLVFSVGKSNQTPSHESSSAKLNQPGAGERRRALVLTARPYGCGCQNQWYPILGVGAPPIFEPILVGLGMFTGGTGFGPMAISLDWLFVRRIPVNPFETTIKTQVWKEYKLVLARIGATALIL